MDADSQRSLSYKDAGVDIDAGNRLVKGILPLVRKTHGPQVIGGMGGFAGLFAWSGEWREPVLVSSTDGVGTKLMLATAVDRHDTVGIDLVAMSVNDILTVGARPLFFLDYIAAGKLDSSLITQIIGGIVKGCEQSGCALIGGETAELPGMYANGVYDLAGFAVGAVERSDILDGQNCSEGDLVLALPSSGLHSNGYSLARKVLVDRGPDLFAPVPRLGGRTLADELLKPTCIYVEAVSALREAVKVRAMCHITGGGLVDNPPRVFPKTLAMRLHSGSWSIPEIMMLIQERGAIEASEMRRTFNMGLGFLAIIPALDAAKALRATSAAGGVIVGELVRRSGEAVEWV